MIGESNKLKCCDLVAIGLGDMTFLDIYVISIVFFSKQEMFYICGILHESMFGVILISDFKI